MEHTDALIILSHGADCYIGICQCCSTINFVFKNIAIKFKEEEFEFFKDYMKALSPDEFIYESRTGKNIFMATPMRNIVFAFSKQEIVDIKKMINEASIMMEVNKIINH